MTQQSPSGAGMAATSRRRLAGAAGIMMVSMFASRVLGFIRDAIISGKLGQDARSDVYMAAFQLPDALFFLIAGGALSSAFIPVFSSKLAQGDEEGAWRLFSTVATVMFVVVGAFILACYVFTEPLVRLLAYGFGQDLINQIVPLTRIILPAQMCFFLGGLMMGAQQARGTFALPALGPNIYNLGIILGGLVLFGAIGTAGLCWGALLGAIAGNFCLQVYGIRLIGGRFRPSLAWRDPDVMQVWKLMLPVILGLALPQVSIQLNRIFASTIHGSGPMSTLTRANTLMQAPLAMFGQSLAIAVFPTLSAQAALGDWTRMRAAIGSGLRFVLLLTAPSTALLIVLGRPIIALLLQHGRYGEKDTLDTALALTCYAIGLAAWSGQALLARSFYALKDSKTPVIIGTAVTLVFVPMNFLFMRGLGMGFAGLALATSVAAVLNALVMLIVLSKRVGGLDLLGPARLLGQLSLASLVMAAVAWGVSAVVVAVVPGGPGLAQVKLRAALELLLAGGAGVGAFVLCVRAMHVDELRELLGMLRRRSRTDSGGQVLG